ncbi:C39 family peptidase [Paenibacillus sp. J22TS3]|uniref:C39 family peptidase n=1 Tax=Paenibacillus sp. J22TS3 TaxID=2807192 RepID=UPI001B1D338A|nr:C39 family peptidase [Paenibacillus sp. J22TS3]GIP19777.1 hypothetical protein J22TS3_00520 [Paenibacillus sp. J22TS3]
MKRIAESLGVILIKKVALLAVAFLFLFASSGVSFASNDLSLGNTKLLKQTDVLKIVQTNLEGYMKNDLQTHDKKLTASKDFIPLYDLDHNLFAYMVPLLEEGREIGYITVGAIEDGYATYEINIQDKALSEIKAKLKDKAAKSNGKGEVVFIPPLDYLIKVSDQGQDFYFDPAKGSMDVTDKVKQTKEKLKEDFKRIRKVENKKHISDMLAQTVTTASVTQEDVALTVERNYGMFVPVEYTTNTYSYGGDQNWYDTTTKKDRGCGPTAAANLTNYLAKIKDPVKYGKLYVGNTNSKTDFVAHMDKLYSYIDPGMFGETSGTDFTSDVERFARDRGVALKGVTNSASFTLDNVANYIKAGLNINSPVATLNTKKWSDYEYEWHWMTITKYYRDVNDNRWIAVSTWGQRRSIDYRVHFDAMANGWVMGGVMYFQ